MSDWQISLTEQGQIVEELDDIRQAVLIIMTTQKGSDPLKPLFGVDHMSWIDRPVNVMIPGLITEITNQIQLWEQRIKVVQVTYQLDESNVIFTVYWELVSTGQTAQTLYSYGR